MIRRLGPGWQLHVTLAAVLALAVLFTMGASILGLRVFLGADILESFAPWRTVAPDGVMPTNPLVGDTVDAVTPARAAFAEAIRQGDIAMWQPNVLGGRPLAALPNTGLFSPFNIPFWGVPLWYAPAIAKLLELSAAVAFTVLFLRRLGVSKSAGVVGGLIFAFSGFQVVWTNWTQTHVAALIAALFWAVERSIEKRTLGSMVPIALVTASMWFAGFPSVTGYALVFAGCYALVRSASVSSWTQRLRGLGVAAGAVFLGTSLAAIQLIPFVVSLSRLDLTERAQTGAATLPLRAIATLAVPNAFGSPVDRNYFGPANYIELQSFIGIAALVLVCLGVAYGLRIVDRGPYWYFLGALVSAMWLTYVGGLALELLQVTPLFGINFIGRLRSVTGFLFAVVAAFGFEAVLRRVPSEVGGARERWMLAAVSLLTSGVVAFALFRAWQMARANLELEYFRTTVIVAVLIGAVAIGALVLAHLGSRSIAFVAPVVFTLLIGIEAVSFASPFWPQIPRDQFYPVASSHEYLEAELGHNRFAAAGLAMYPGTNSIYGLRSATGHAFHDPRWRDLLEAVDPDVMRASPTFSILSSSIDLAGSPVLDRLGVSHFVVDPRVRIAGRRVLAEPLRFGPEGDAGFVAEIPVADTTRGAVLFVDQGFTPDGDADTLELEALTEDGQVMARGTRRLVNGIPPGLLEVSVPETAQTPDRLRLRYRGDTDLTIRYGDGGSPVLEVIYAIDDGLRLAHAAGTVVYERSTFLPRIRWAGTAEVVTGGPERIEMLATGPPPDTVLLEVDAARGSGAAADVAMVEDDSDVLVIDIEASGDGYLVVADTMRFDWIAYIDDQPADVLAADHALAAVAIPEGDHRLRLEYEPAGQQQGTVVTVGAALLCGALFIGGIVGRRAARRSREVHA